MAITSIGRRHLLPYDKASNQSGSAMRRLRRVEGRASFAKARRCRPLTGNLGNVAENHPLNGGYSATKWIMFLQRDVRAMANIEGLTDLPRVLTLLATRASALHNLADISRSISIPHTTLKRYLTLLETTFLLVPLAAWSSNLGKRLVKAPKLVLSDTGLGSRTLCWSQGHPFRPRSFRAPACWSLAPSRIASGWRGS